MRTTSIGEEKTPVPVIGVGCMGIGGYFSAVTAADSEAVDTLQHAFDRGLTLVDTAEGYAAGHSEELIGRAVSGRRDQVYVATKVSPEHLSRTGVLAAAENSLKRLSVERIDLFQVHWPNPKLPLEETMSALESLVVSGKVRHIGLSNFTLKELRSAQGFLSRSRVSAVQMEYNLFDRSAEKEYLPFCRSHGIALIAYSPLDQGQICGGPRKRMLLEPIAQRKGCSLAQLALAWIIAHEGVLAIPKAARRDHVDQNAAAGDINLSPEDMAAIDAVTAKNLVEVPVHRIRVAPDDSGQRNVYRTVEEARANPLGFTPSPLELAEEMSKGQFLKAVRVRPAADGGHEYDYDLVEGRIRYWAWVLAFDGQRDIPVLVRD